VRREWDSASRLEANNKFYQEMLKRYTVTIEPAEILKSQIPTAKRLVEGQSQE